ncbi:hypothetical protein UFOVP65_21 [uncultured Caudovirales phage]|uniref:Uncharacterized protein n=1 Tax=uncultured Caudovirales phage TaxID=2100421 RepID=A0A6J5KUQ7_9CAUD|nr:hypothetical protein UFOVP65_21 [uncultured Caudovirales phage]
MVLSKAFLVSHLERDSTQNECLTPSGTERDTTRKPNKYGVLLSRTERDTVNRSLSRCPPLYREGQYRDIAWDKDECND